MPERESVRHMWAAYLAQNPTVAAGEPVYDSWHFCDNQTDADELVELVLAGQKRATAALLRSYEIDGDPLTEVGDHSVVTDWSGRARCVLKVTGVDVVPFEHVSAEFAATEGEGDGSLAYWRRVHIEAFSRELAEHGEHFTEDLPIVCQRFDVVYAERD